jgi:hypothetical protein
VDYLIYLIEKVRLAKTGNDFGYNGTWQSKTAIPFYFRNIPVMNFIKFVELKEKRDMRPDVVSRKDAFRYEDIFAGNKQAFDRSFNSRNFCHILHYPVNFLYPEIDVGNVFGIRETLQQHMLLFIGVIYAKRKPIQAYLNG